MFKDYANVPSAAFIIQFILIISTVHTAPTTKEDQLIKSGSEKAKNGLENLGLFLEKLAFLFSLIFKAKELRTLQMEQGTRRLEQQKNLVCEL